MSACLGCRGRGVVRGALLVAASLLLGAGTLLALALQTHPGLAGSEPLANPAQARQALGAKLAGSITDHEVKQFTLTAQDLAMAASLAIARKRLPAQAQVSFHDYLIDGQVSLAWPPGFSSLFLNIRLLVDTGSGQFELQRLRIGDLVLPNGLVRLLLRLPPLTRYAQLAEDMVASVGIKDDRLRLVVHWNREVLGELRGLLMDVADKRRLLVYQERLTDILERRGEHLYVRLTSLLPPLFQLAQQRSQEGADPVEENRAALVVLSAYANGKDLSSMLGTGRQPPPRRVLLNKRVDTAKHFLGAASMAMSGQGTLVEMIGLAKELHDTHDGSGFSFIDLAADEAGALLGKTAVRSPEKARRLQALLNQPIAESQFLPELKDLPESMHSEEFGRRFKGIGSPEYEAMRGEIAARIRALPLYREY